MKLPEDQSKPSIISTNIEDHIKPEQIEKAIIDKELQAEPVGIEESASVLFGLYLPKFTELVNKLSNKSLKRLIYSLVAVPLEEARLNLKNEDEKVAYAICEQLLVSKSALIMNAAYNEEQRRKELKDNSVATEEKV